MSPLVETRISQYRLKGRSPTPPYRLKMSLNSPIVIAGLFILVLTGIWLARKFFERLEHHRKLRLIRKRRLHRR